MIDVKQRNVKDFIAEHEAEWDALPAEEREIRRTANLTERERVSKMSIDQIIEEGYKDLAKSYDKEGWTYKDLPKMSHEHFQELRNIVHDENFYWLSYATYYDNDNNTKSVRGQCLISPDGMNNIATFNENVT